VILKSLGRINLIEHLTQPKVTYQFIKGECNDLRRYYYGCVFWIFNLVLPWVSRSVKITNKLGLPQPIVDAVSNDDYDPGTGDISCTTLINAPQIRRLGEKYKDEITEDASDRIYSLVGQAIHNILERADTTAITEERLYNVYTAGHKEYYVSGKFDRLVLLDGVLQDYKMCSVWEMIYGFKKEKTEQLNVLADLAMSPSNGYKINKIQIVAIFRDWQKSKAALDKEYPQHQVAVVDLELWDEPKRRDFITDRLAKHFHGDAGCTDEERWMRPRQYAVKKVGNKRATKVHDTLESAQAHERMLRDAKPKERFLIDERPALYTRCDSYCSVAVFCPQHKAHQEYLKTALTPST
jgi:hypothetical protein